MINLFKLLGIISLAVLIGLIFIAGGGDNGGGNDPPITDDPPITNGLEVTVAMWSTWSGGWDYNVALRINVNGNNLSPNARLTGGHGPVYRTFIVQQDDVVQLFWVNGGQYDYECAFAVYYSDALPNPAFNPDSSNWSPTNDPSGRVLLYKQFGGSAVGNDTLLGSFTVSFNSSLPAFISDDPSTKIYLDGSLLENNGITILSQGADTITVSISSGTYSDITWYLNGIIAAQGASRTSITLSKQIPGTYQITVEATPANGVKNSGSHNFLILFGDINLPVLTGMVSITGSAQVNQTLMANTFALGGEGNITYQWKRNGVTVIGSNISTYAVQYADVGSIITVTVTRSGNSGSITSSPFDIPNTGIIIDDPSIKLYLNGNLIANNGTTTFNNETGSFDISIDSGTYTEIIWYLNGNIVAQGASRTSITLSKQIAGTYKVIVEATPTGGVKNSASHNFIIQ